MAAAKKKANAPGKNVKKRIAKKQVATRKTKKRKVVNRRVSTRIARIRKAFDRGEAGSSVPEVTVVRAGSRKKKDWNDAVTYIAFKNFDEAPFKEKPFSQFKEAPFDKWKDFWNYIEWKDKK